MALKELDPFNFETFQRETEDVVLAIVNGFESCEHGDWVRALDSYSYRGSNRAEGEAIRQEFYAAFQRVENTGDLLSVCERILEWGGMNPLSETMKHNLKHSLEALNSDEPASLLNIDSQRIASISKIYEMWDPNKWIIYDSYCARGLEWMISEHGGNSYMDKMSILNLPCPAGRTCKPYQYFPSAGSDIQRRLGFIYGSWLCRAIVNILNNRAYDFQWNAYHVEMVAFQLGHEI